MWVELICGLLLYRFLKRFFLPHADPLLHHSSHFTAITSVAKRLEKLNPGCKLHLALRIPDPDSASRRNIDLLLLTHKEAMVICVNNVSGLVSIEKDGNWVCQCVDDKRHLKTHHLPNPVREMEHSVGILEEYLEQRGVSLPQGYISYKVICPNPDFHAVNADSFPPEVITYDQYTQLKPGERNSYSGWIRDKLLGGKKKVQESLNEKLNSVLRTAPVWDRLELKDNKHILGEFLEFRGSNDDLMALRKIKRSKVSHFNVHKTAFGFVDSTVQITYFFRDYRTEVSSWSSECVQVEVGSKTELVFLPQNSTKPCKLKVSSVVSLSLSA